MKIDRPLSDTLAKTSPMMPNGARLMIQRTMVETASAVLAIKSLVVSLPRRFIARPNRQAHIRIPM